MISREAKDRGLRGRDASDGLYFRLEQAVEPTGAITQELCELNRKDANDLSEVSYELGNFRTLESYRQTRPERHEWVELAWVLADDSIEFQLISFAAGVWAFCPIARDEGRGSISDCSAHGRRVGREGVFRAYAQRIGQRHSL